MNATMGKKVLAGFLASIYMLPSFIVPSYAIPIAGMTCSGPGIAPGSAPALIRSMPEALTLGVQANLGDSEPGGTYSSYYFYFANQNALPQGSKFRATFPAGFDLSNVGSYDTYADSNSITDQSGEAIVDQVARTVTTPITLYDEYSGIDGFYYNINNINNPLAAGTYTLTLDILDANNNIIGSGTDTVEIETNMGSFYVSPNDFELGVLTDYYIELYPNTTNLQDGEFVELIFPKTSDLSAVTLNSVSYPNLNSTSNFTVDNTNKTVSFQVNSTGDSNNEYIEINLGSVINPTQPGDNAFKGNTRENNSNTLGNIIETGATYASFDNISQGTLDSLFTTTPLSGETTTIQASFYPNYSYELNWTMRVVFPIGTDLSTIAPSDVSVTNPGLTSPVATINDTNDYIDINIDGTTTWDPVNISIDNFTMPASLGENKVSIYTYDGTGYLCGTDSESFQVSTPGTIPTFNIYTDSSLRSMPTFYELRYKVPSNVGDNWEVILDFDDDVDLSNFDYDAINDDLNIYDNSGGMNDPDYADVNVDLPSSTISIILNMSRPSEGDLRVELYDVVNPSTGGLKDVNITHKDAMGNIVDTGVGKFLIDGDVSVSLDSNDRGDKGRYYTSFTPTNDINDNYDIELTFPADVNLSHAESFPFGDIYGGNIFGASSITIDNITKKVRFIDISGTSNGSQVYTELDDIINPELGSNSEYTLSVEIFDETNLSQETLTGYFYIAAAGVTTPSVTLTDNIITNTSSYQINYTPSFGLDSGGIIHIQFPPDTDLSNFDTSSDVTIAASASPFDSPTVTKDTGARVIEIQISGSSFSGSGGTGSNPISISLDNIINASIAGNYDLTVSSLSSTPSFIVSSQTGASILAFATPSGNYSLQDQGTGPYTLVGPSANQTPTAPDNLFVRVASETGAFTGQSSPATVASTSLEFSARYNDPDSGDIANGYEIEIYDDAALTSLVFASSGEQSMSNLTAGTQSSELTAGGVLVDGTTYYWRVRFHDDSDAVSPFSDGTANFTVDTSAPTITSATPADGATGVSNTTTFTYIIEDTTSAPDSTTLDVDIDSASIIANGVCQGGVTTVCTLTNPTANQLRIDVTLTNPLPLSTVIPVSISVADTVGNTLNASQSFTTGAANQAPTAPDNLFVNIASADATTGNASPATLSGTNLEFSARYNDPDGGDIANQYEIEIYKDAALTSLVYASGGGKPMANTTAGTQSGELTAGGTIANGQTYYWRMRFYDDSGTPGAFSDGTARFTIAVPTTPSTVAPISGPGGGGIYNAPSTTTTTEPLLPSAPEEVPEPPKQTVEELLTVGVDACTYFKNVQEEQSYDDIRMTGLEEYTDILSEYGVVLGKNPTSFVPGDTVTRSEILRAVLEATCARYDFVKPTVKPFPDVELEHPDVVFIDAGKREKVVNGYLATGLYRPDTFASRAEALKIIMEAVLIEVDTFDGPDHHFSDVTDDEWFAPYVRFAEHNNIISKEENLSPNNVADREYIAKVLARTLTYREALIGKVDSVREADTASSGNHSAADDIVRTEVEFTENACEYFDRTRGDISVYGDLENSMTYSYVRLLQERGVIFSDSSTFDPTRRVSRSEILRLILQASCEGIELRPIDGLPFPDVLTSHPDASFVEAAKRHDIVKGYGDGLFRPDQNISRAEALKIIMKAIAPDVELSEEDSTYEDVLSSAWFAPYIATAEEFNFIDKVSNLARPMLPADRAYIAEVLARVLTR